MVLKKSSIQRVKYGTIIKVKYGTIIKCEGIIKAILENPKANQNQSWGQLHANVIDYNYNYFEIS